MGIVTNGNLQFQEASLKDTPLPVLPIVIPPALPTVSPPALPIVSPPATSEIIVRFESIEQFKDVHKAAAEFEDALEAREIDEFNKGDDAFRAWPLLKVPETDDVDLWVILVEPKPSIATRIPSVGEYCQLCLADQGIGKVSTWWSAKRVYNNFANASDSKRSWANLLAFNVTLVKSEDDSNTVIKALIPDDCNRQAALDSLCLDEDNAAKVGFFFTKSNATFEAEMRSLSKLVKASTVVPVVPPKVEALRSEPNNDAMVQEWLKLTEKLISEDGPVKLDAKDQDDKIPMHPDALLAPNPNAVQPQQVAAFKYLIDFAEPEFTTNIFRQFPHMIRPDGPGSSIPLYIKKKYMRMNEHQREAYHGLLSNMPCGIAMLPGGPGGGKTDWAMTVIGIMQSKSRAKVLYMLDINDPLDDATAKYIGLMKNAGLGKRAIRMKSFGTELKRSVRVDSVQRRARKNGASDPIQLENSGEPEVDFSKNFLALYTQHEAGAPPAPHTTRHQHIIPTLDEAAWNYYEECKSEFKDLEELLETCNNSALQNRSLRNEIYNLYSAVLRQADFIATTPCVAASAFRRMFRPDLVVLDEAAHARELSGLIAIANFCPKLGWIFIGDHRQTQPTVKSNNTNPYGKQLATSTMERAYMAGVLKYQLLINHRAYGGLERLPSKLIYDGKMKSGIPFTQRFPRWARFVRQYLEGMAGQRCLVPRIIVHLEGVGSPVKVGTSWYHAEHTQWTMDRVLELIKDKRFRSAENEDNQGTILLLAPYKAAVAKYQEAIEELATKHPNLRIPQRVEARTWDSSQGHEADIIGIDYVRGHPTGFMDGMYRFNVGLTRARQGEWHLMHPNMPKCASFAQTKYLSKLYSACNEGTSGFYEGRIANLVWGMPVQFIPPKTSSRKPAEDRLQVQAQPGVLQVVKDTNTSKNKPASAGPSKVDARNEPAGRAITPDSTTSGSDLEHSDNVGGMEDGNKPAGWW